MHYISEFATSLIIFSLVATLLEMLIPNSNFKKYVQFVIGLILVVIIFTPVSRLLKNDFYNEVSKGIENVTNDSSNQIEAAIDAQKVEIMAGNKEYILNEFSAALIENANEEMIQKFNYSIDNIDIVLKDENSEVDYENISQINVRLTSNENSKGILPVEEIRVGEKGKNVNKQATRDLLEVQKFLIEKWELGDTDIGVNITL